MFAYLFTHLGVPGPCLAWTEGVLSRLHLCSYLIILVNYFIYPSIYIFCVHRAVLSEEQAPASTASGNRGQLQPTCMGSLRAWSACRKPSRMEPQDVATSTRALSQLAVEIASLVLELTGCKLGDCPLLVDYCAFLALLTRASASALGGNKRKMQCATKLRG